MDPDLRRKIASMGSKAAHLSGNAHEFTSEEARVAGRRSRNKLKSLPAVAASHVQAVVKAAKEEKKAIPRDEAIRRILKEENLL